MIQFGSVCSGIEAASVAWEVFGWRACWFAEIDDFPSAVLAIRYPEVPNFGDMRFLASLVRAGLIPAPAVLVGGTPCQAYSIAGLRQGLSDERGALTLAYVELIDAVDDVRIARGEPPCIVVWENVPGVYTSSDNAFGYFLSGLAGDDEAFEPGPRPKSGRSSTHWTWKKETSEHFPKWPESGAVIGPRRAIAWRTFDAQYFGLAQRRRRVFLIASARDGFDPTNILFEFEGVRRDTKPSREAGEESTAAVTPGIDETGFGLSGAEEPPKIRAFRMVAFGEYSDDDTASTMKARDYKDHTDLAVISVHGTQDPITSSYTAHALGRNNGGENAVLAFAENSRAEVRYENGDGSIVGALSTGGGKPGQGCPTIQEHMRVRRLMPVECETLQGFPRDWTKIPYRKKAASLCPDGPRYKALGNSKAVPCVRWIGQRIDTWLKNNC